MLVDLGRNDLGRVCEYGIGRRSTRSWPSRPTRTSCTSSPRSPARCARTSGAIDALRSVLPGGHAVGRARRSARCRSSTSSSRSSAAATAARSASCPTPGDLDTCIYIRTVVVKDGVAHVQAGGGTVADAKPDYEYEESRAKARGVAARDRAGVRSQRGLAVMRSSSSTTTTRSPTTSSSTWASSGPSSRSCATTARRVDELLERRLDRVVVSPGPCTPNEAGISRRGRCAASPRPACRRSASASATSRWRRRSAAASCATSPCTARRRDRARRPDDLRAACRAPLTVGRYHSLVVDADDAARRARGHRAAAAAC